MPIIYPYSTPHHHNTAYATADHDHDSDYLGITAEAADSDKVDGLHAVTFGADAHVLATDENGNILTDTTTGMKIGTAPEQKLALWGNTPIIQPAGAAQAAPAAYATGAFGLDSDAKMQALFDLVVAIRTALVDAGIMKGGA